MCVVPIYCTMYDLVVLFWSLFELAVRARKPTTPSSQDSPPPASWGMANLFTLWIFQSHYRGDHRDGEGRNRSKSETQALVLYLYRMKLTAVLASWTIFSFQLLPTTLAHGNETHETDDQGYVYVAYYQDNGCGAPVALKGFVTSDALTNVQPASTGSCITETLCLDASSPLCLELTNRSAQVYEIHFNSELDDSQMSCSQNLVYPSCYSREVTRSGLVADAETLLKNTNPPSPGIEKMTYLPYFYDSECKYLAGVEGLNVGNNTLTKVSSSVSCEEAMACLLSPEGETCQALPTNGTAEVALEIRDAVVYACDYDEGVCNEVPPNACVPSSIYPSCYHRILSAQTFFSDPKTYLGAAGNDNKDPGSSSGVLHGVGLATAASLVGLALVLV